MVSISRGIIVSFDISTLTSVEEERMVDTAIPDCRWSQDFARIYTVLGEHIATLPIENDGSIAPSQLEALPQQPLWAGVGTVTGSVHCASV